MSGGGKTPVRSTRSLDPPPEAPEVPSININIEINYCLALDEVALRLPGRNAACHILGRPGLKQRLHHVLSHGVYRTLPFLNPVLELPNKPYHTHLVSYNSQVNMGNDLKAGGSSPLHLAFSSDKKRQAFATECRKSTFETCILHEQPHGLYPGGLD